MLIYDGIYSWDGNKYPGQKHICWWPGAYNLKIVDCSENTKGVHLLKPYISIFSNTGNGTSIINCTQNFMKKICQDFNLEINRVLWVEHFPDQNDSFEVASIKKSVTVGDEALYSVSRREIMSNELLLLKKHFKEFNQVDFISYN